MRGGATARLAAVVAERVDDQAGEPDEKPGGTGDHGEQEVQDVVHSGFGKKSGLLARGAVTLSLADGAHGAQGMRGADLLGLSACGALLVCGACGALTAGADSLRRWA